MFEKIYNAIQSIIDILIKYSYIISPILGTLIYLILKKFNIIKLDNVNIDTIINLNGVFIGFLFTSLSILFALPRNKFIEVLKNTNILLRIYRLMFLGIIFLLISLILFLFQISIACGYIFFIFGLSEMIISIYNFYKVIKYSNKSK